jgi:hypothetical protein
LLWTELCSPITNSDVKAPSESVTVFGRRTLGGNKE